MRRSSLSKACANRRSLLRESFGSVCALSLRHVVRITYTKGKIFNERPSRIVVDDQGYAPYEVQECEGSVRLRTSALEVRLAESGALSFYDVSGRLLMREPDRGGKWLTAKDVLRQCFHAMRGPRMRRAWMARAPWATVIETVVDRRAFEAKLEFVFAQDEALFGFGSHEEGYGESARPIAGVVSAKYEGGGALLRFDARIWRAARVRVADDVS